MAIINHKYQLVFLAEPHTGSRAVRDALCRLEGSVETNGNHHLDLIGCVSDGWLSHNEAELYTVFSVIRDPHDLLVSRWRAHHPRSVFGGFLPRAHVSEQIGYDGDLKDTLFWRTYEQVDWFIRYEMLQWGFDTLLQGIGAHLVGELPVVGKSQDKPNWRDMWDPCTEDYVRQFFPDVRRYDYRATRQGDRWQAAGVRGPCLVKPKRGA